MHWPASMPWSVGDRQRDAFRTIQRECRRVCDRNYPTLRTFHTIHFGRVVMVVVIKYRPGFQFPLLSNSNPSVFDDHGMEAGLTGPDFGFALYSSCENQLGVCDINYPACRSLNTIHFGRVAMVVAIDYRSGFQILTLRLWPRQSSPRSRSRHGGRRTAAAAELRSINQMNAPTGALDRYLTRVRRHLGGG